MWMARRFWRDQSGATAIEYGIIAVLIAMSIVSAATAIGTRMSTKIAPISAALT